MSEHTLAILVKALGAQQAAKDLKGVDKAVAGIGTRAGKGLSTFGHNLKSAFTTPLGLLGITGGLFGLEHILSESIGKAQEFGAEVARLQAITGLDAETTSALAAAMEHFGISADDALRVAGMLEKNVGNLTKDKKTAAKFEKQYGLQLLNTNGTVKDANQLLLQSADYFNNKNIPAQTKAAGLAKLYGRNWQQMVPFLKAGSKGIKDAEEEAKRLGLTLTKDNIDALKKNKAATREWNTALGGLELQIGLKLLPHLTDLANVATSFVSQHGDEIVQFFGDAATFAGQMGQAIHDDVLPVIQGIGDAWGKIPADLKKLLIAGFVVNKLSGGALTGIAGDLAGVIGKGLATKLGLMTVTAGVVKLSGPVVGGGGGGNGLPGAGAGAGGAAAAAGGIAPEVAPMSTAAFLSTAAAGAALFAVGDRVTKGVEDAIISVLPAGMQSTVAQGAQGSRTQAFGGIEGALNFVSDPSGSINKMSDAVNQLSGFINAPHPDFLGDLGKLAFLQYKPPTPPKFTQQAHDSDKNLKAPKAVFAALKKDGINLGSIAQHRLDSLKTSQDGTKAATRDMDKNLGSGIAETKGAVSTSGSLTSSAVTSGTSGTTASVNVMGSRIVAAVAAAARSVPIVNVNVSPTSITHTTVVNRRAGTEGGSRVNHGSVKNDHGQ